MKPADTHMTGDALIHCYEALRNSVGHADRGGLDLRGLALLMRQGIAVWMRSVGTVAVVPRPQTAAPVRPEGIDPGLVHIVAAMALAHLKEART